MARARHAVFPSLPNAAITCEYAGRYEEAEDFLQRSLEIYGRFLHRLQQDPIGHGITLAKLGVLRIAQNRLDEAEDILSRALAILDTADGDKWFQLATTELHLAKLWLLQGLYEQAILQVGQAKRLFDEHQGEEPQTRRYAQMYGYLAYCHAQLGHNPQAQSFWGLCRANLEGLSGDAAEVVRRDAMMDVAEGLLAERGYLPISAIPSP